MEAGFLAMIACGEMTCRKTCLGGLFMILTLSLSWSVVTDAPRTHIARRGMVLSSTMLRVGLVSAAP